MRLSQQDFREYSTRYYYPYDPDGAIEKRLKGWLKINLFPDKPIFIEICSWKSPIQKHQYKKNSEVLIKEIVRFSFTTKSEEAQIESLRILRGVDYPVASAILHFAFPYKYPILDRRVLWSLAWEQPKSYSFDFWQNYCLKMIELSNATGLDIRTIDKALWQYSKENQKP